MAKISGINFKENIIIINANNSNKNNEKLLRDCISLNGQWKYILDSKEQLVFDDVSKRFEKDELYDKMFIPSNWQLKGLDSFNGSVWFYKYYKLNTNQLNEKLKVLVFNGVDYFTEVWLNGNYVGNHEGYFQRFWFDVSKFLLKKNALVLKVTSPLEEPKKIWPLKKKLIKGIFSHHDCRPGGWSHEHGQDQNTGGIWNDVSLELYNEIFIDRINIHSKLDDKCNIANVFISLNYFKAANIDVRENLILELSTPSGRIIRSKHQALFKKNGKEIILVLKISNPELWWSWDLGKANLYHITFKGKNIGTYTNYFGIREVSLDDNKVFYLNGKRLFLRGTNVIPEQMLSSLNRQRIKKQVELIKAANINIIRMHAHVNRKEYYAECDRQGILVWQDFALQWTYDESTEFVSNAVRQIKDMVSQLYNHPSIAFWCCHNEPGNQINTLDPHLRNSVLSEDKTRIVRLASNYEEHPYDGWYWGDKEHFSAIPMGPLVTEFGAQALPAIDSLSKFIPKEKQFPPDWDFWKYHNFQYEQTFHIAGVEIGENIESFIENSQNYQSSLLKTAIDFYRRKRFSRINGMFQFMFVDCWPSITWSVIDYYGKKKKGYDTLRKCYQPLYVSINLRQQKYFRSQKLNTDIWVINDFHKLFNSSRLIFKINNKVIGKIETGKIEGDSKKFFNWESVEVYLPKKIIKGRYTIYTELIHNRKSISFNDFDIEIME